MKSLLLSLGFILITLTLTACDKTKIKTGAIIPAPAPKEDSPPWVMHSSHFYMLVFQLPEHEVRPYLPDGVKALVNNQGMVNAGLEIYETDDVEGLPNYKAAFVVVDIEGHPSNSGMQGRFPLWGSITPNKALDAFTANYGFPYEAEFAISIKPGEAQHGRVLIDASDAMAGEHIKLEIQSDINAPLKTTGVANMLGMRGNQLVKAEVPFLMRGYQAKVQHVDIRSNGNPILKLIEHRSPVWAIASEEQIFSYMRAQSVHSS